MKIIEVTPENVLEEGLFCIKDTTNPGFSCKHKWFQSGYKKGLKFKLLKDEAGKPVGFIEYIPGEHAWRPVNADGYYFIHCIMIYPKKKKGSGRSAR